MRVDEILAQRSAIPALGRQCRDKVASRKAEIMPKKMYEQVKKLAKSLKQPKEKVVASREILWENDEVTKVTPVRLDIHSGISYNPNHVDHQLVLQQAVDEELRGVREDEGLRGAAVEDEVEGVLLAAVVVLAQHLLSQRVRLRRSSRTAGRSGISACCCPPRASRGC